MRKTVDLIKKTLADLDKTILADLDKTIIDFNNDPDQLSKNKITAIYRSFAEALTAAQAVNGSDESFDYYPEDTIKSIFKHLPSITSDALEAITHAAISKNEQFYFIYALINTLWLKNKTNKIVDFRLQMTGRLKYFLLNQSNHKAILEKKHAFLLFHNDSQYPLGTDTESKAREFASWLIVNLGAIIPCASEYPRNCFFRLPETQDINDSSDSDTSGEFMYDEL